MTMQAQPTDRRADALRPGQRTLVFGVMLLASFAYNFNFIIVDYLRAFLVRDGVMTLSQTALLYTAQSTGVLIGSFAVPPMVSRFGNRWGLVTAATLLALGTALNMTVDRFEVWLAVRFFVGIALAGCYIASITLLVNLAAPHVRARVLSVNMAMFSIAQASFGLIGTVFGGAWRSILLIATVLPAIVAVLTLLRVPDDRSLVVFGNDEKPQESNNAHGTWKEMLQRPRLMFTIACILLAGLNFSAYQFYSGFITTYLLNTRGLDPAIIGWFVVVDGVGGLLGTIALGWVADRYGRKSILWGFPVAAAAIVAFLFVPTWLALMLFIEFIYSVGMSCTNCWAAYFAELFPVRLRPMGTSLFHGGHVVSLFAPFVVAVVASHAPLAFGMALAPGTLLIAAVIWARLPETLRSARAYRGFNPA